MRNSLQDQLQENCPCHVLTAGFVKIEMRIMHTEEDL